VTNFRFDFRRALVKILASSVCLHFVSGVACACKRADRICADALVMPATTREVIDPALIDVFAPALVIWPPASVALAFVTSSGVFTGHVIFILT